MNVKESNVPPGLYVMYMRWYMTFLIVFCLSGEDKGTCSDPDGNVSRQSIFRMPQKYTTEG